MLWFLSVSRLEEKLGVLCVRGREAHFKLGGHSNLRVGTEEPGTLAGLLGFFLRLCSPLAM